MVDRFLRPPEGPIELFADALRGAGVLGVVVAAVFYDLTDAGIVAFALPGLFAPRFIGLRPGLDVTTSVTLLVAAWSNVFDLYTTIGWWDVVVHVVCTGVLAAGLHVFLAQQGAVPIPGNPGMTATVAITTTLGLALSALWEMVEWLGYRYITEDIHVTYDDTIGDMAAGGLGALCAGFAVFSFRLLRYEDCLSSCGTPEHRRDDPRPE